MTPRAPFAGAAVLVAAGRSTRLVRAAGVRKPFLELAGKSVLEHALAALDCARRVGAIVVVGHADDLARLAELARSSSAFAKVRAVVAGGAERTDSVRAGVLALPAELGPLDVVAVHDAARALVLPELVDRALERAHAAGAALLACRVHDTIKHSADGLCADATLERSALWAAQTPQAFRIGLLRELLARAEREGFRPTDDAALHERYVGPIALVEGDPSNLKITTPADLVVAAAILRARAAQGEHPAGDAPCTA